MTIRTLKFYGRGYGETPASIVVTQNGVNIYTGEVDTIDAPDSDWASVDDKVALFTGETTVDFAGTIPMSIEVTGGIVVFAWVLGNYSSVLNPVYSNEQIEILYNPDTTLEEKIAIYSAVAVPAFSSAEIAILQTGTSIEKQAVLTSHNAELLISSGPDEFEDIFNGDERSNVTINGDERIAPTPRPAGQLGTWFWSVAEGDILTYDLNVSAGQE